MAHWKSTKTVELSKKVDKAKDLSRGPAPPSMVAASAKRAFGSLSKSEESRIAFQNELQNLVDDNPIVVPDTTILVRSLSGKNLQIPSDEVELEEVPPTAEAEQIQDSWSSEMDSLEQSSYTGSSVSSRNYAVAEHELRRTRNLTWLRSYRQTLSDIANLAYDDADLWQLHQYFFSPPYDDADDADDADDFEPETAEPKNSQNEENAAMGPPPVAAPSSEAVESNMGRTSSFRTLGHANAEIDSSFQRPNKRSSLGEELKFDQGNAKRAKNSRKRISYYPRIKESLETKPQVKKLCLLRQLKYVENTMLEGKNVYSSRDQQEGGDEFPSTSDVEMVLLDLM